MTKGPHLGAEVTAFVDGELHGPRIEQARAHLASCPACSQAVRDERRLRALVARSDVPGPPGGLEASLLAVARSGSPGEAPPLVVSPSGDTLLLGSPPLRRRALPVAASVGAVLGLGVVASLSAVGAIPVREAGTSPLALPVTEPTPSVWGGLGGEAAPAAEAPRPEGVGVALSLVLDGASLVDPAVTLPEAVSPSGESLLAPSPATPSGPPPEQVSALVPGTAVAELVDTTAVAAGWFAVGAVGAAGAAGAVGETMSQEQQAE